MRLRLAHGFERVDQMVRSFAEHDGASDLGVKATRSIVLDQNGEVVAFAQRAVLEMRVLKTSALSHRRRAAEIDALFAALQLALVAGERDQLDVAHAGL